MDRRGRASGLVRWPVASLQPGALNVFMETLQKAKFNVHNLLLVSRVMMIKVSQP